MNEVNSCLSLRDRKLSLHRFPKRANETLQAWDAGDEYVINYVEDLMLEAGKNILIINDSFGALSCWFSARHNVTMISDSFISHQATLQNAIENKVENITLINATDQFPNNIDLVLLKLPKNNRLLIWQLHQLRNQLTANCPVVGVNKAKEIHTSTLKLFTKYLGGTKTSLAWKKHRLVFSEPNSTEIASIDPIKEWPVEGENFFLKNHPNTYSGESLDLGARFMLRHLPGDDSYQHVIDLGCGNGVLSVKLSQLNPSAKLTCVDESYMALESAKINVTRERSNIENCQFIANNCLDGFTNDSADLVVCNPPFHQNNAITDHIAWQMFCDAKHVLWPNGKLIVIGNSHLGYDEKLSRLFGRSKVTQIARNNKFVILQATK
ncbi:methyltransferase [Vibrio sp. TH_r3]|uniref:methyltransferase n=1 Tax=Vibrio sp. TH_r3 TaxID=3082084 RepID=UPI002955B340|nr:methyltransferase [Vibrio sp. TH_r3]MDV7104750.1 methyltransferase [Vibrio sp. TH_r3]